MNNEILPILIKIYEKHGDIICQDSTKFKGLMNDYAGQYKKEINILTSIIYNGIIEKLNNDSRNYSIDNVINKLSKTLAEDTGFSEDITYWGIGTWAIVLKLISKDKLISSNKYTDAVSNTSDFNIDKVNISMTLEIHFHQPDEVSFFIESNATGEEEKFGEILLFCCVTNRIMINFGNNDPVSTQISNLLKQVNGNLKELAEYDSPNGPKIVKYQGSPGRKRIEGSLKCSNHDFKFNLNMKGFGLLGNGIGYYAPNAVISILRYFAKKRINDEKFLSGLSQAAEQCGIIYSNGQLTLINQLQCALMIAVAAAAPDEDVG